MLVVRYQDPLRFQVICRFGGVKVYGRVETNLLKEQGRSDSEEQWLSTKQMIEIKAFK